MPIPVTCPSCRSSFSAPDTASGKRAKCPTCGGAIEIPGAAAAEEILDAEPLESSSTEAESADRKPCPMCGEMIRTNALKCRFCGHTFDATLAQAERYRGPGPVPGESVEEAAKRLVEEKYAKTTAIQLFVTGLLGCFSPILVVYGIVFLLRRPYPFPYKGLAIAGTVIHGFWTLIVIASIVVAVLQP
jgi:hypothetical protein